MSKKVSYFLDKMKYKRTVGLIYYFSHYMNVRHILGDDNQNYKQPFREKNVRSEILTTETEMNINSSNLLDNN